MPLSLLCCHTQEPREVWLNLEVPSVKMLSFYSGLSWPVLIRPEGRTGCSSQKARKGTAGMWSIRATEGTQLHQKAQKMDAIHQRCRDMNLLTRMVWQRLWIISHKPFPGRKIWHSQWLMQRLQPCSGFEGWVSALPSIIWIKQIKTNLEHS